MISPRRTRLVRVATLKQFRDVIAQLAASAPEPQSESPIPSGIRNPESLIVVPTRDAARQLQLRIGAGECVTRDELYDRLHARLADPPRRASAIERDVMAQAAARAAAASGLEVSFQLRAGLIAEMLRFYDQLRRQSQPVARFEELIGDALGSDEGDRAALRMRRQTLFLVETFREYERRLVDSGACDEHLLRDRLVRGAAVDPVRRVIVTVPDWIADAAGLYVADFDLLARIPGLSSLDVVATEPVLGSGFHERLHNWLPGIEEVDASAEASGLSQPDHRSRPVLVTPPDAPPEQLWWVHRDREEELIAIVRAIDADRRGGENVSLERHAVVFKTPLPYLYLAPEVFESAGMPFQTNAALPLATEPTAAALDLVLTTAGSRLTRDSIVALLRSPHFVFVDADGSELTRAAVSTLDRALSDARYLGDLDRLAELETTASPSAFSAALTVAVAVGRELEPLTLERPASEQIRTLLGFWRTHARPLADDRFASRERRARGALDDLLSALAGVHAAQDDPLWSSDDLAAAVRRAVAEQTFVADSAVSGVQLLDDQAVRYGDFDTVAIVGLIEADWPETPRRNIFYPPALLKSLGWPSEKDRRAADDARFLDLLGCASKRTSLSTFTLEDDALVSRSVLLDEVPRSRLSSVARKANDDARVFVDEALSIEPPLLDRLDPAAREWAALRMTRTPADSHDFHGSVGALDSRPWSVSALETYLDCPFKFYAQRVLKLEEEPDDEEVMDPRRQGQFVHEVFEAFFKRWQDAGHRAITRENLSTASQLFTDVVDEALERLPAAEAGLERTRLLGSSAAAGLGDAVLRMEAERPTAVVERLLEHPLTGEFTFAATAKGDGELIQRTIALRGKADRLDLLADGTFRLIDYKLGWPRTRTRALQLPIYSLCAEQQLASHRGRRWTLGEAVYLAFKGPRRVVPLFSAPADRPRVLAEAQQRLVDTVDAIAAGEFPPTPDDVFRCETCSYAAVCRKDYVGDV